MPVGLAPDAFALWGAAITSANKEVATAVSLATTERWRREWVFFTN